MDLALIIYQLGITDNAGPDLSTYESMAAGWRSASPIPTQDECEATWKTILDERAAIQYAADRQREYLKRGVTPELMVVALWEKLVENKPDAVQQLQDIRDQVKAEIPQPASDVVK